jgi:hypothetical protein
MSTNAGKKDSKGLKGEAPPALIAVAILIVLCVIGAGAFYIINNGWQTQGQKDDNFYHSYLPLENLHHGDPSMFNQENELRKKQGRPLLVDDAKQSKQPHMSPEERAKGVADSIAKAKALEAAKQPQ